MKKLIAIALVAGIGLGTVHFLGGCASPVSTKTIIAAALKDAYRYGGSTAVSNRIEQLVVEGKVAEEQAAQLHALAQGVYERVIEELDGTRVGADAEPCEDDANCGNCDQCRDAD